MGKIYRIFYSKEAYHRFVDVTEKMERQRTMDAVCLALNEEFGFGAERFAKFRVAFVENYNAIVDLQNADVKADKELTYSKAKIDEALKRAVGEKNFSPWEVRYDPNDL